ncbi:hypothetical protein [Celeribacter sp.]|uniref:hypothetical protein n=1 Tax=Celeribacter sp. TaxID=1890673 RepID=UPI003A913DFF
MTDAPLDPALSTDHHAEEDLISPKGVVLTLLFITVVLALVIAGSFLIGPWVLGLTALAFVPVIYIIMFLLTIGA